MGADEAVVKRWEAEVIQMTGERLPPVGDVATRQDLSRTSIRGTSEPSMSATWSIPWRRAIRAQSAHPASANHWVGESSAARRPQSVERSRSGFGSRVKCTHVLCEALAMKTASMGVEPYTGPCYACVLRGLRRHRAQSLTVCAALAELLSG